MEQVRSKQGDTVDLICWQHYGKTAVVTEAVLTANPGLASLPVVLPAGVLINLPEIGRSSTQEVVNLWT